MTKEGTAVEFCCRVEREYLSEAGPYIVEDVVPGFDDATALVRSAPEDIRALTRVRITLEFFSDPSKRMTLEQCAREDTEWRGTA